MLEMIRYLFRYNAWATELMLTAADTLSADEFNAPGCSGIGSVRDTLVHLLMTQQRWIETMQGTLDHDQAMQPPFTVDDIPTVADARARWLTVAALTDAYLDALTEDRVRGNITLSHPRRGTLEAPHWRLLMHVGNHGTHHRAQVFAAVRRAGHEPAPSDLLFFSLAPAGK